LGQIFGLVIPLHQQDSIWNDICRLWFDEIGFGFGFGSSNKKKKKKLVQTKPNQNQVNKSGTIIKIRNRKIQEPFDRYSDLAL